MPADIERLKDEGTRQQVVIAGGAAGLVSRFCIAPLDVVKIRLQLQVHSLSDPLSCDGIKGPIYKGVFSTLRAIARQEGIRALWKGNIPAELMYVCYGGVQFTAYRSITQVQSLLPKRAPPSIESFISGAGAGAAATTVTYPLDLLRTRFAAQGPQRVYTGLLYAVRDINRIEGFRGFFRGLSAAVGQIVPYMGLFFSSYEFLHQHIGGKTLPFGSGDATAGIFASVFAKTAVFPLDLVRKRLQVQGPTRTRYIHTNIPEYNGVIRSLAAIWRREGYRGWYRGLTVSLVKAAPASAVTMWTYEQVLHALITTDKNDELWEIFILLKRSRKIPTGLHGEDTATLLAVCRSFSPQQSEWSGVEWDLQPLGNVVSEHGYGSQIDMKANASRAPIFLYYPLACIHVFSGCLPAYIKHVPNRTTWQSTTKAKR